MAAEETTIAVELPYDVQQEDETGYVRAFLAEARVASRIVPGAIVVCGVEWTG
jgi:hypothetical protein